MLKKREAKLGWEPKTSLELLSKMLVKADIETHSSELIEATSLKYSPGETNADCAHLHGGHLLSTPGVLCDGHTLKHLSRDAKLRFSSRFSSRPMPIADFLQIGAVFTDVTLVFNKLVPNCLLYIDA